MLTFVEKTCLLVLDDKGEFLPIHPNILECALVGAVLMDLAFAYRIDTDPQTLTVTDSTPTGEDMLDRVLARIGEHGETNDTVTWIKLLSREAAEDIRKQALGCLVDRGVLQRQEKRSLLGFRKDRYSTLEGAAAREAKDRIRAIILSDDIPDPRDTALLSLVDACNILPDVFPDGEIKNAGGRIKQLRNMDLLGRDIVGAVAEIERVIVASGAQVNY